MSKTVPSSSQSLAVQCPECRAEVGDPCRMVRQWGLVQKGVHAARRRDGRLFVRNPSLFCEHYRRIPDPPAFLACCGDWEDLGGGRSRVRSFSHRRASGGVR